MKLLATGTDGNTGTLADSYPSTSIRGLMIVDTKKRSAFSPDLRHLTASHITSAILSLRILMQGLC